MKKDSIYWADFFEKHIIIHTHIAKSSGTSIVHGLKDIFGLKQVLDLRDGKGLKYRNPEDIIKEMSSEERNNIKVLTGHFWYGTQDYLFNKKPIYIASVRDPISRYISLYNYAVSLQNHPFHEIFVDLGIGAAGDWFFSDEIRANEISLSLGIGGAENQLQEIGRKYAVVVPHYNANELIQELSIIFTGETKNANYKENIGTKKESLSLLKQIELRTKCVRDEGVISIVNSNYKNWLKNLESRIFD